MSKKKILLIGGGGFIGSNLIHQITTHHYDKVDLIILGKSSIPESLLIENINLKSYIGNVADKQLLEQVFIENLNIDIIIHLINTNTPLFYNKDHSADLIDNLIPTIYLLDLSVKYKVTKFIFFSSGGAVYGNPTYLPIDELHSVNPISPYGIIKLTTEKYIELYNRLHGLNFLIFRVSNPYGPHHKSVNQGFINVTIRKIIQDETIEIWGDGTIVKDWIFVEDMAHITVHLALSEVKNQVINIGAGEGARLNDILSIIRAQTGSFNVVYKNTNSNDVKYNILNTDKCKQLFSLKMHSLEDGIQKTIQFYKQYQIIKK